MTDGNPIHQPMIEERIDKAGKYRLHMSVPNPSSRMNLGMPWFEKLRSTTYDTSLNRFGYKGISFQTDSYFFADIEKHSLFHTGKSMQLQAGKEWMQYVEGSSWMASKKDSTFAADKRVTIVAGAGQGPRKPLPTGMDVRLNPYNNLRLHYVVDSVMMGVSEFMLGRRRRADRLGSKYSSRMPHLMAPAAPEQAAAAPPGGGAQDEQGQGSSYSPEGFYDVLERAREELIGHALPSLAGLSRYFPRYVDENRGKHHEWYGYGKYYFSSFDPYEMKKVEGVEDLMAALKNALAGARRLQDVLNYYVDRTGDVELLRVGSSLGDAFTNANNALGEAEGLATLGDGVPSSARSENAQFGASAPFDRQLDERVGRALNDFGQMPDSEPVRKETAVLQFAAPEDPDGGFAWRIPGGAYGYLYTSPDTRSERRMHTNVVPGWESRPQLSFANRLDASSESRASEGDRWIWVGTDGGSATFRFRTSVSEPEAGQVYRDFFTWWATEVNGFAEVSGGGLGVTVASRRTGPAAFVELRADSMDTFRRLGRNEPEPIVRVTGHAGTGPVRLTPSEVASLIRNQSGDPRPSVPPGFNPPGFNAGQVSVEFDDATGVLTLTAEADANHADYEFYITAGGQLFAALGASQGSVGPLHDNVPVKTWHDEIAQGQQFLEKFGDWANVGDNVVAATIRPFIEVFDRLFSAMEAALKALEALAEAAEMFADIVPKTPSALGLFAKDGISLGTTDRIVSAAGKGYVFIADGGTGEPDVWKFIPGVEEVINAGVEGSFRGSGSEPEAMESGAHGFTVLSNSDASVITRSNLDLLAIGSQLRDSSVSPAARGTGVARLAATHRAEVLGTSEVLVAAGSAVGTGRPDEADGTVHSTVDVQAHRIAIGSFVPEDAPSTACLTDGEHDMIPWPRGAEGRLQLDARKQHRVVPTERVDVRAHDAIHLMLGTSAVDLETAQRRLRSAQTRARSLEEWLADQSGLSATLDEAGADESPTGDDDPRLQEAQQCERTLQELVRRLRDGSQSFRATIDVQPALIRIGFCNPGAGRWGPHLRITEDDIRLMCATDSPVCVQVNDREASVRGTGDEVTVGACARTRSCVL